MELAALNLGSRGTKPLAVYSGLSAHRLGPHQQRHFLQLDTRFRPISASEKQNKNANKHEKGILTQAMLVLGGPESQRGPGSGSLGLRGQGLLVDTDTDTGTTSILTAFSCICAEVDL